MVQLIEILGNKKAIDVILFFLDNGGEYSQIELSRKVKLAKATAVKWLKILVDKKILFVRKIGPVNLYTLNPNNEFAKEIKRIKEL